MIDPELRSVLCIPDPTVSLELVAILASGSLLAFLLELGGSTVLHASAVEVEGAAIAFVGGSGSGKSTVAALLCAAGNPLVADDVLRLGRLGAGQYSVAAGAQELRLRRAARSIVDRFAAPVIKRETADDRLAVRPLITHRRHLPLAALVLPRPRRDVDRVRIRRLTPPAALVSLLAAPRLPGWIDSSFLQQQFADLADLARHVRVLTADVPWGPPFDSDIGEMLRCAIVAEK